MIVRRMDKRIGLISVSEGGKDKDYQLLAGSFTVSYSIDRKNAYGRKVRMSRRLDPNGAKALVIRKLLDDSSLNAVLNGGLK